MCYFKKHNIIKTLFLNIITLCIPLCHAALTSQPSVYPSQDIDNSLLIFLDESESHLGAITNNLLVALSQETAPIIASSNLIRNILTYTEPQEKDPQKQFDIIENEESNGELQEIKNIILSLIDIKTQLKEKWLIKEINTSLYLLIPKEYVISRNISLQDIDTIANKEIITETEKILGLKVNHMITKDSQQLLIPNNPEVKISADYFVFSLHDIFVLSNEYEPSSASHAWSFFVVGHGQLNHYICNLSLAKFRDFLSFLEEKIKTKTLVYMSCYAAGTNEKLIYTDTLSGADKTYNFTIIALALTDSPTYENVINVRQTDKGNLFIEFNVSFTCFFEHLFRFDKPDYLEATKCLDLKQYAYLENIAQIRYPGLSWFSILDNQVVVALGKIMSKTRTNPLNIATYFAKQGKPAEPYGILFYAHDIPFELIIETKYQDECYVPKFVSMIPGQEVHHIKKISSSCNNAGAVLNSFFIAQIYWRKIYIIEEIEAPFSQYLSSVLTNGAETTGILRDVVVDSAGETGKAYFNYNGEVYFSDKAIGEENSVNLATDEQKAEYHALLKSNLKQSKAQEVIRDLNRSAQEIFMHAMKPVQAKTAIINLLEQMPNNTLLHLPEIASVLMPRLIKSWQDQFENLAKYHQKETHKTIWFDRIQGDSTFFKDVIIEITPQETHIFYHNVIDNTKFKITKQISKSAEYTRLTEDYTSAFKKSENLEQLTAEDIAKIKDALARRAALLSINPSSNF